MRYPDRVKPGEAVKAETINALIDVVRALELRPGRGYGVSINSGGTTLDIRSHGGGSGAVEVCLLGQIQSDSNNAGKVMVRPGFISGGGASVFLEKGNLTPTAGRYLWVKVEWLGKEEDGVLLEGGTMESAEIESGLNLPDDDVISVDSLSGNAYIPLGKWNDETPDGQTGDPVIVWRRAGCGSISIKFCPQGGFLWARGDSAVDDMGVQTG